MRPFRLGHRASLDVLRGIAVAFVVAHHFFLVPNGALGVDIFFVLSGFLITTILCEEFDRTQTISIKRFYLRRVLRLAPLLYTLVIGYVLVSCLFSPVEDRSRGLLEALTVATYTSNVYGLHGMDVGPLAFTWSLCVEEHFYLIWPVLLFAALKFRVRRAAILVSILGTIVGVMLWRSHVYDDYLEEHAGVWKAWFRVYSGTDTRADGLLVGCVLGLLASWNYLPHSKMGIAMLRVVGIAAAVAAGYCIFFVPIFSPPLMRWMFTGFAVLVAISMAWLLAREPEIFKRNSLAIRALAGLGKLSYGLYLVHLPITELYSKIQGWEDHKQLHYGWSHPVATAVPMIASVVVAWACYRLIERPALKFKKRLENGGSGSSTTSNSIASQEPACQSVERAAKAA